MHLIWKYEYQYPYFPIFLNKESTYIHTQVCIGLEKYKRDSH